MVGLIILAYLTVGFLISRQVRTHYDFMPRPIDQRKHSSVCDFHYQNNKRKCNHYPDCDSITIEYGKVFLYLLTPVLWPLYGMGWFMLTPNIIPQRETLQAKTERLRIENSRQLKELDDIDSKLKAIK